MRLEWKYTLIINVFILITMSVLFMINDRVIRRENELSKIEDHGKGAAMREIAGKFQKLIERMSDPELLKTRIINSGIDYSQWDVDVIDVNVMDNSGAVITGLRDRMPYEQLDSEGIRKVLYRGQTIVRYLPRGYYVYGEEEPTSVLEYIVPYIYYASPVGDETLGAIQILFSAEDIDIHSRWLRLEQLIYVSIATISLTIFINPLTSRLIVRRLERLMETITAAQAGDLAIRAVDSSRDEIGRLSTGFNRMMERISSEHASRLEALGNLAAGVAHEVRNPLNSIAMTTQYLKETIDVMGKSPHTPDRDADSDIQECLDVIGEQVKVLDRIVKQFLQLTRPVEMNWERVDLNSFLVDVMRSFASSLELAKVKLKCDFSRELLYARVDCDKMRQAISNIVINSIQAMPDGGELTISTAWDTPQRTAVIEIRDTGVGVPQENIARLFEPYFTTKPDGTGLGLAITYRIVEAHNGEIRMESEEGKGTTLAIILHQN